MVSFKLRHNGLRHVIFVRQLLVPQTELGEDQLLASDPLERGEPGRGTYLFFIYLLVNNLIPHCGVGAHQRQEKRHEGHK